MDLDQGSGHSIWHHLLDSSAARQNDSWLVCHPEPKGNRRRRIQDMNLYGGSSFDMDRSLDSSFSLTFVVRMTVGLIVILRLSPAKAKESGCESGSSLILTNGSLSGFFLVADAPRQNDN